MFRPDVVRHTVKEITKGTRLLWSVGGVLEYPPRYLFFTLLYFFYMTYNIV
jgi:hypothetical protein